MITIASWSSLLQDLVNCVCHAFHRYLVDATLRSARAATLTPAQWHTLEMSPVLFAHYTNAADTTDELRRRKEHLRIGRPKDGQDRRTHGTGQMHGARIIADQQIATLEKARQGQEVKRRNK